MLAEELSRLVRTYGPSAVLSALEAVLEASDWQPAADKVRDAYEQQLLIEGEDDSNGEA